jgi:spore maturation protein B
MPTSSQVLQVFEAASQWAVPTVIMLIILTALYRKVPMYESFVTGAKEGFGGAVMIIPYLVAMLLVIKIFIASGMLDDIKYALGAVMRAVGLSGYTDSLDLLPLALTKPLSGSAARGVLLEIFDLHGPDSFLGNTASIMMGSTETTFYVMTVYFGAVNIKKLRHALPACLLADAAGIIASIVIGYVLYGHR